jgi:RHS repeat-associated protein
MVSRRSATSTTWKNADGSITVHNYSAPQFYRPSSRAGYVPIHTALAPVAGKQRWRSGANDWHVSFGAATGKTPAEQISIGKARIGFAPRGALRGGSVPAVSGSVATYSNLWRNTDLTDDVTSDSIAEGIVLHSSSVAARHTFTLSGASAHRTRSGGLDLVAGGRTVGVVPAPTVSITTPALTKSSKSSKSSKSARSRQTPTARTPEPLITSRHAVTQASKVRWVVSGNSVSLVVSPSWLAALPTTSFPVVVDPSFSPVKIPSATQVESFSSTGGSSTTQAAIGQDSAGALWAGAAFVPFAAPPAPAAGQRDWEPALASFSADCGPGIPCPMKNDFLDGLASKPTTYNAILGGTSLFKNTAAGIAGSINANVTSWFTQHETGSWFGFGGTGLKSDGVTPGKLVLPGSSISVSFIYYQEPPSPKITAPTTGSLSSTVTPTITATTADSAICAFTNIPTPASGVVCDQPADVSYDFKVSTSPFWTAGPVVADSGWIPQPFTIGSTSTANGNPITTTNPSWTVPAGSLTDGMTYYVTVQDSNTDQNPEDAPPTRPNSPAIVPLAIPQTPVSFTVKLRLGSGGPSPTDTVGSPPGQTSTPSQGAPSPGMAPSSETVNMVTGDLSLAVGTPAMNTLSGPATVSLSYDSVQSSASAGSNYGLTGSYFPDSGSHAFPATPVGTQIEPDIDVVSNPNAPQAPPIGGILPFTPYLTRWTGTITLPSGSWQLGGLSSGGIRVFIDGSTTPVYDDWAGTKHSLSFATTTLAGTHQIKVEAWDTGGSDTTEQLWANNVTNAAKPIPAVVASSWLTPMATGLPAGWSISAATAFWSSATDLGSKVVLHSSSGETATFTNNAGTYQPEVGDTDSLTELNGAVRLSTSSGYLYRFNAAGQLVSMTTIADDRHPTALQYTYGPESSVAGSPIVLQTITDPVSGRSITLSYGSATACTSPNTAGMLCRISYWDGTSSTFTYNGNAQLAEVLSPGSNTTLLGYDSDGRIDDIRDALANDVIAAGGVGVPACSTVDDSCVLDTWISYDSKGRVVTITQPQPVTGAARPKRTYTYVPSTTNPGAGTTRVSIAGFSPAGAGSSPAGIANSLAYDAQSRIVSQTDSAGHSTDTVWDTQDRPIITLSPAGEQSSLVYDVESNETDVYGPAPAACFDHATVPVGVTVSTPVIGYLPLANSATAAGCGVSVPHTHNGFDQNISGLADTYWSNGQYAGAAALHSTGNGGTAGAACAAPPGITAPGTSATNLCATWPAGMTPAGVTTDAQNQWSLKMTGTLTLPSGGAWGICVLDTQAFSMIIDGQLYLSNIQYEDTGGNIYFGNPGGDVTFAGIDGSTNCERGVQGDLTLAAGQHTIEIDTVGSPAQATSFDVSYAAPSTTTPVALPVSILGPGYGLKTSTVDPDGKTTVASYSNGIDPAYALPNDTVTDPTASKLSQLGFPSALASSLGDSSGLSLDTHTTYEPPGAAGSYLRKTSLTLPAGNASTYSYYAGTDGPVASACGVGAGTPQGGEVEQQTDPSPGTGQSGSARVQQFIYNALGEQAGVRVGSSAAISSAPWRCLTYDARNRLATETWPATSSAPARTVTHAYAIGGNPLVSSVADSSGTIISTVDLLGRPVSYTDASGQSTTISYNQAGQTTQTVGPDGNVASGFDPNTGQLTSVSLGGVQQAAVTYCTTGNCLDQPASVTYAGNSSSAAFSYSTFGRANQVQYSAGTPAAAVGADAIDTSPAGRIVTDRTPGANSPNPNPAGGNDFTYDGAGRLTRAYVQGEAVSYSYGNNAATDGCSNANEGANTNVTSTTTTPTTGSATTIDSCYNGADELVSTTNITSAGSTASTHYSYDAQGNQTADGPMTYTWDASGRLATATSGTTTVMYSYDALDRVISQTQGTSTASFAYCGYTSSPCATLTATHAVAQGLVPLPGGVLLTTAAGGNLWSYPNLTGNLIGTMDATGTWSGQVAYTPYGASIPGQPALGKNTGGNGTVMGAFGSSGKVTTTGLATSLVVMGARAYNPSEGRFLSVDPIEGGCANAYVYVSGDPLNSSDLTGQAGCHKATSLEEGEDTIGLIFGGQSALIAAALVLDLPADALVAGIAAGLLGGAAVALDITNCIKGGDKEACAGAILGGAGLAAGGAATAILKSAPSEGSKLDYTMKALGGIAAKFGIASLAVDLFEDVGVAVCEGGRILGKLF